MSPRPTAHLLVLLLTVASTAVDPSPSAPHGNSANDLRGVVSAPTVTLAYPEDGAVLEWATSTFEDAGLAVPTFTVEFHTTPEPCKGYMGLHSRNPEGTVIRVCATHERTVLRDGWRRRTLIHEMAHAWVDQNVAPETAAAFMRHRGVVTWSDPSVAWELQGAEHAAEVVMAAIQDDFPPHVLLADSSPGQMAEAYSVLTGT